MQRIHLFLILLLLSGVACASIETTPIIPTRSFPTEVQVTPTPAPEITPVLHRGVNMGNMLEAPNEGDWGLTVQEEYFDLIKEAGFDFIRLPIRWDTHSEKSAPYTIDPVFLARVDDVVGWALQRNLPIIVDFHYYDDLMTNPSGNKDGYLEIWKQVAEHYKNYPPNVLFELLNEPNSQLDAALWNQYSGEALSIVRAGNPTRDVIVGPVNWNAYDWLSTLNIPPGDEHLIVTFHYYLPFEFTHQGAEWVGSESNAWLGTTWDGTDSQKAEIISNFDSVAQWAKEHNLRILLGEFGAYSKADMASRARWTEFVARQAELHNFAWAYWEFGSVFGVYDPQARQWREPLLQALIPQ